MEKQKSTRLTAANGRPVADNQNVQTDVNLQNKMLIIRDSKNGKERLVPFSDSLATILTQYRIHRVRLNPSPSTSHFFLSARGRSLEPGDIYVCFKRILHKAGIPFKGNHYGPRVHDFRHTFAVRSFDKNERNGIKASESVPFLSTYLGHDSLYETEKYLKFSGNYFEDTLTKFNDYSGELFPEVIIYE